jgi:hypothetical protein
VNLNAIALGVYESNSDASSGQEHQEYYLPVAEKSDEFLKKDLSASNQNIDTIEPLVSLGGNNDDIDYIYGENRFINNIQNLPPDLVKTVNQNMKTSNLGHLFTDGNGENEVNLPMGAEVPVAPANLDISSTMVNHYYGTDIQYEPSVAVGPVTGNVYMTWIDTRVPNSTKVYFAKSTDKGKTFQGFEFINGLGIARDPVITCNKSETIFIVWSDDRQGMKELPPKPDENYDIYLNKSTDYGETWLSSDVIVNANYGVSDNQTNPCIAISDSDTIYIAWQDGKRGHAVYNTSYMYTIVIANSTDGGATFPPLQVKELEITLPGVKLNPDIVVDENEYVWLVWSENRTTDNDYDIYFTRSSQIGMWPFNSSKRLDDAPDNTNQNRPVIELYNQNKVYVAWEDERSGSSSDIYFAKYAPGSDSFPNNMRVNDYSGDLTHQTNPSIALTNSGQVYLSWLDERNGYNETYFAKSNAQVTSFSKEMPVEDDFSNLKFGTMQPTLTNSQHCLAVHTDGTIYVLYSEYRYGSIDIFLQRSIDGGGTWTESIVVNENGTYTWQGTDNKYDIAIGPGPEYPIHIVWTDSRAEVDEVQDNIGDIYYARSLDFGKTFSKPTMVSPMTQGAQRQPSIAVNDTNGVYITWTDTESSLGTIYLVYSTDGGDTFEPQFPPPIEINWVNQTLGTMGESSIAVNSTGFIFVVFTAYNPEENPDHIKVYVAFADNRTLPLDFSNEIYRINDAGVLFPNGQTSPDIAIDHNTDNVYIVWEDWRNLVPEIYLDTMITTQGPATTGSDVLVNDTTGAPVFHFSPSVAVNSTGNISVVWSDNRNGTFDIRYARSTDKGATFGDFDQVNSVNTSDQINPVIAVGDNDNIYVVWADQRNGDYDVYMTKSTDKGITFSTEVRVDDDTSDSDQTLPNLAAGFVNATDMLYLVWRDQRDHVYIKSNFYQNNYNVYFTSSDDDATTFIDNFCIHDFQGKPSIAVDNDGIVHATWVDYRTSNHGDIYYAKSYVGGQFFDYNMRVYNFSYSQNRDRDNPQIIVQDDVIYLIWEEWTVSNPEDIDLIFSKSTNGGLNFTEPVNINNASLGKQQNPAFEVDSSGKIYLVWEDNLFVRWNINYSHSTDGGATWSIPIGVNSLLDNLHSTNPCIAINNTKGTPEIYVAYRNNSVLDSGDITFARSTDGGSSFKETVFGVNNDTGPEVQDYPAIDVDSSGNIILVWEDNRNYTSWEGDIYYAISKDSGQTFETNAIVNLSTDDERRPDVSFDPSDNNNITVVWQDNRNTLPDENYDIYISYSTNAGTSFAPAMKIDGSGTTIRDQMYPKLATDSSGSIYCSWQDLRNDASDVYLNLTLDRTMPVAEAGMNIVATQGEFADFIAKGSMDNLGIANFTWTFNDGGPKTLYGYNARYRFVNPGFYTITLKVTDYFGNEDWDTFIIDVVDNSPPDILNDLTDTIAYTGDPFTFRIDVTDFNNLQVKVDYKYGPSGTVIPVMMNKGAGNQFTIQITVLNTTTLDIYYKFSANDTMMNWKNTTWYPSVPVIDNKMPNLYNNITATTATTGDPFTFSVDSDDNIGVLGGVVKYKYGPTGSETSLALTKSGVTYSNTINIDHTLTPLIYLFNFNDASNNWNNASNIWTVVTITDNDPPVFELDASDAVAYTGTVFNFILKFNDNILTNSAHVEYWYGTSSTHSLLTLIKDGNYFNGSIIIQTNSLVKLNYKFHFNDTNPLNAKSTSPVQIDVLDNINPTAISGSRNIQTTTGESFEIWANFDDNIGVNSVKVYYKKVTDSSYLNKGVTGTSGNYSITNSASGGLGIDTTNDDTNWQYYFMAKDAAENSFTWGSASDPYPIAVRDNDKPVAKAGEDKTAKPGDEVTFDGTMSSDNIGIANYIWKFTYGGTARSLTGIMPKFTFDTADFYVVTLNVTDATGNWDTDSLWVNVTEETTPPDIVLDYPTDGDKLPKTSVILRWHTNHPNAGLVTYDVYWGPTPNPSRKEKDLDATELELTGLVDKTTYYWKVQPKLGSKIGEMSEELSFSIDLEFQVEYGVDITAEKTSVVITVGDSESIIVTVKNTGNDDDFINLDIDKGTFQDTIELTQVQLILTDGQSEDLTLKIFTTELTSISNYLITVTATSQSAELAGEEVSDFVVIDVQTVAKPTNDVDNDNLPDDWEIKYFGDITSNDGDDDPDSDGKTNLEEWAAGTDPTKKPFTPTEDTDQDGLLDSWENEHFGSLQYGPNDDPDEDGVINIDEYNAGTDPNEKKADGDGDGDDEDNTMMIVGVVIVIVVIVLLLLFMMMKKKGGAEPTKEPEEETGLVGRAEEEEVTPGPTPMPTPRPTPTPSPMPPPPGMAGETGPSVEEGSEGDSGPSLPYKPQE